MVKLAKRQKAGLALILLCIAGITIAHAATQSQIVLSESGIIGSIGLNTDPSTIEWGQNLALGQSVTKSCVLTNVRASSLMMTIMYTNDTNNVIDSLTWDADTIVLQPNTSVLVNFTLIISTNATIGPFAFDIHIITTP